MTLAFDSYLDAASEDVARFEEAVRRDGARAVPTCPGWTVADLLTHLAEVYEFWHAQLLAGDTAAQHEVSGQRDASRRVPAPERLEGAAAALLGALGRLGPDAPCWNWTGHDLDAAWVARRLAHETSIHRTDAERAFGKSTPIERELAVDGIDERIAVLLAADLPHEPGHSLGGTLCLVCSDVDAAWVVEVERARLRWRRGRGPADAALVGSASDLDLFVWNRIDLEALSLTGSRAVAEAWRRLPV